MVFLLCIVLRNCVVLTFRKIIYKLVNAIIDFVRTSKLLMKLS